MPTKISLKRAAQSAIILLIFVAVLMVWPFKLICSWVQEGELQKDAFMTLYYEETVLEEVVPQQIGLTYIEFALGNEQFAADDKLKLAVYNENMDLLESREVLLKKFSNSGICKIKLSSKLAEGTQYYFSIQNLGRPLELSTEDGEHLSPVYIYKADYSKVQYLVRALLILAVGGLLLLITEQILGKNTRKVRFDYGVRLAAAVLLSGFCLWLAYCVFPGQKFSTDIVDIIFYEAGIFLFLAYMLYGLLHKREDMKQERLLWQDIKVKIPGLLQVLAFAGTMTFCICRANSPTSYEQILSDNFMYFCFAIVILCGFTKKELWSWYNLIYGIVALATGVFVWLKRTANWDPIEQMHLRQELFTGIGKWIIWGFIILNTVLLLWRGKRKTTIRKGYLLALAGLFTGMIIFRNGRRWPIDIAVFWGIFAVQMIYRGNRNLWLKRFAEGILLQFVGGSIFCVLYRPYLDEWAPGYRMTFQLTTWAGVYLALILVVALAYFMEKYKAIGSVRKLWKEAGIVGIAAAFTFMTISRIGLLTALVVSTIVLMVMAAVEFKDRLKGILLRGVILLGISCVSLVIMFTACRTIPAVVSNSYVLSIEAKGYETPVIKGEEWDSEKFITVKEFFNDVDKRLFHKTKGDDRDYADALSSGRITLWKAYLKDMNWTGHVWDYATGTSMYAHNEFIQVAFYFGIAVGIYFLIICICSGVMAVKHYMKNKKEKNRMIPAVVLASFGICSLTDWTFYPTFPTGFAFLTILIFLIIKEENMPVPQEEQHTV